MSRHDQSPALEVLFERVLQGDASAFAAIVERYQGRAYSTAYQYLRNRQDAEEVTQDAFVNVFRYLSTYRGESQFTTWLYRVVCNLCLTRLRRRSSSTLPAYDEQASAVASTEALAWEQLQGHDRERYVRLALDRLLADDRLVLTLHYLADKPVAEIATITGWSVSAVKVRLLRARQRLEKALHTLLDQETKGLL